MSRERPAKRARIAEREEDEESEIPRPQASQTAETVVNGGAVHQGDSFVQNNYYPTPNGQLHDDKAKRLLESLAFDGMEARYHNIELALSKTCQWLLQDLRFKNWKDTSLPKSNFLWVKGKPGCGKSTLMKFALDHVVRISKALPSPWTFVSYFFNARASEDLHKSPIGLYRSIIHAVCGAIPSVQVRFTESFTWKLRGGNIDWSKAELQNFLRQVVQSQDLQDKPLYIFIDALDEGSDTEVRQMLSFFDDLASTSSETSPALRICFSSRHYPSFAIDRAVSLTVEDESEHDADIRRYIDRKLIKGASGNMQRLRDAIFEKSQHVFFWVVLVTPILNDVYHDAGSVSDMFAALKDIPAELNDLFASILARNSSNMQRCVHLLRWVLFAFRSLNMHELYLAVLSSDTLTEASRSELENTIPSADVLQKTLVTMSRGLVGMTRAKVPKVQFIHETVRTFLMSEKGLAQLNQSMEANLTGLSHDQLKLTCFNYLETCKVNPSYRTKREPQGDFIQRLSQDFPFMEYSLRWAYHHADQAQANGASQAEFLQSKQSIGHLWNDPKFRSLWNVLQYAETRRYKDTYIPIISFMVEQDTSNLLKQAYALGCNLNVTNKDVSNLLVLALRKRSESITEIVLQHGANFDAIVDSNRIYDAATAMLSTNEKCLFLIQQWRVKIPSLISNRALRRACIQTSPEGILRALNIGADPWHVSSGRGSVNAFRDYELTTSEVSRCLDILLRHNEALERSEYATQMICNFHIGKETALHFIGIAKENHERLLGCGEPDLACNDQALPVTRLLLGTSSDGPFTLCTAASPPCHISASAQVVLQRCLEEGSIVSWYPDLSMPQGPATHVLRLVEFDLYFAAVQNSLEAVTTILDEATDIHPHWYCQALDVALGMEAIEVAEHLCRHARTKSPSYSQWASTDLVRRLAELSVDLLGKLLQAGLSADMRDRQGGTILQRSECTLRNSETLIDYGMDINAVWSDHGTALQFLAQFGQPERIEKAKLLLRRGADVDISHRVFVNRYVFYQYCETALAIAVLHGNTGMVSLLLGAGAQVDKACSHEDSLSALDAAAYGGWVEMLRLLISRGVVISGDGVDEVALNRALKHAQNGKTAKFPPYGYELQGMFGDHDKIIELLQQCR